MNPIPPIAPNVPVLSTQVLHQPANTSTQPWLDSPWTRMNIKNANGTSGTGRRRAIVRTVGKVRCSFVKRRRMVDIKSVCVRFLPLTGKVDVEAAGSEGGVEGSDCIGCISSCCTIRSVMFVFPESSLDETTCIGMSSCGGGVRVCPLAFSNRLCLQSWHASLKSMSTAAGTVTCHTGTPTVLTPTSTLNVTSNNMLPNIAPRLSTSAAVWTSVGSTDKEGGTRVGERNKTKARSG